MVVLEEEVGDVTFHGKTACPSHVVPLEIDACEFSPTSDNLFLDLKLVNYIK